MRWNLTLFLLLFSVLPLFSEETELFLREVRKQMDTVETLQADFIQKKQLRSFRHELVIKGKIALDKQGKMAWHILEPIPYSCVIDGDRLTQWDADSGKKLSVDTRDYPALQILTKSMTLYFRGDFHAMSSDFTSAIPEKLVLELTPNEHSLQKNFLKTIRFRFAPDLRTIREVVIRENSEDVTTILFEKIRLNEPIPAELWRF